MKMKITKPKVNAKKSAVEKAALTSSPVIVKGKQDYESCFPKQHNFKTCTHDGSEIAGIIRGKVNIYGSKLDRIASTEKRLLLNCSGLDLEKNLITFPDQYVDLDQYVHHQRVIDMAWRDQGVPAVQPQFWTALIDAMIANDDRDLVIFCLGSHGRTGTAIASLLIANDGKSAYEAVEIVRKNHCESCVESDKQIKYLQRLAKFFGTALPEDKEITGSYSLQYGSNFGFADNQNFDYRTLPTGDIIKIPKSCKE